MVGDEERPMATTRSVSFLALATTFLRIGLSSIGGAAAPLRHEIINRSKWLSESEFSELFGVCQTLPGATGANVAVALGQRYQGWPGSVLALASFTVPTMLVAIGISTVALRLAATNPRIEHAETAIAAASAGLFIGNGFRLARGLWQISLGRPNLYRVAQLAVVGAGIALIVVGHVSTPFVVAILVLASFAIEGWREHEPAR